MNTYGFTVAHGYEILKGFVEAEDPILADGNLGIEFDRQGKFKRFVTG